MSNRCVFSFFFPSHFLSPPFFFSLPSRGNSDPGSLIRLSPPLPTTVRALHFFIARRVQLFLPLSSRAELRTLTPDAPNSWFHFCFRKIRSQSSNSRMNASSIRRQSLHHRGNAAPCRTANNRGVMHFHRKTKYMIAYGKSVHTLYPIVYLASGEKSWTCYSRQNENKKQTKKIMCTRYATDGMKCPFPQTNVLTLQT